MKKFIIILIVLPVFAYSQQKKQKRICVPSRTQIIACCDSPKVVVNVVAPQQKCCDSILVKIRDVSPPPKGKSMAEWLIPALLILAGTLLGFYFANRRIYSENKLKSNIEWIKDFRIASGGIMKNIVEAESLKPSLEVALEEYIEKQDESEKAQNNFQEANQEYAAILNKFNDPTITMQSRPSKNDIDNARKKVEECSEIADQFNKESKTSGDSFFEVYKTFLGKIGALNSACNDTLLFLDINATPSQQVLKSSIERLLSFTVDENNLFKIFSYMGEIRNGVLSVIAEKWDEAWKKRSRKNNPEQT